MLFNSFDFVFIFFPLVTFSYFASPYKFSWLTLLLASCIFYMYFIPYYILILLFTIIIDYFAGILIESAKEPKRRKLFLAASIAANVGILCVFKYYNFFIDNINQLLSISSGSELPYLAIILPVGLSFHTFQAMSYTIEVYRNNTPAERHFGIYSLYVMFYPQLVAGPIERPQNILPQLRLKHDFSWNRFYSGALMIVWGLFKKVAIADRIAVKINPVFENPELYDGYTIWISAILFSIQIYCDFSAYSEIALGTAKVMGFNLMENFRFPYFSKSIAEFWSRWHISLSTWFRDYVYIPLGGNRTSRTKWLRNLFIVFMISGFWHGANWTFIIWGFLHACFTIFEYLKSGKFHVIRNSNNFNRGINVLIVFLLVTWAWIFFRSETVADAFVINSKIANSSIDYLFQVFSSPTDLQLYLDPFMRFEKFSGLLLISLIVFSLWYERRADFSRRYYSNLKAALIISVLVFMIALFAVSGKESFIYFQF